MANQQSSQESLHSVKSNDQRLKSPEAYQHEKQKKKRPIREAEEKNAHFKFDSDEEDNQPKKFVETKIQLFDDNERVNVEKVPKKRQKLQDLQAGLTTTNDPPVQFSEPFLDNNDDEANQNDEISFEEEKKKSLAILDQIAGAKPVVSKAKSNMIRFDPSKSEHRIYELEAEAKSNGGHFNATEEMKTKEPAPIVDSKRIYEFDQSKLKSMFDKTSHAKNTSNENGQFQFQFFNNRETISEPVPKVYAPPKSIINGRPKVFFSKTDGTSSDEDEQEKPSLLEETEIKTGTFFFFDIDDRLKDGLDSFVRTEDLNELERTWPTKRKEIGEALRTKHRKAIQRKDKHRVFNHRRRQKQYASANPMGKSDID